MLPVMLLFLLFGLSFSLPRNITLSPFCTKLSFEAQHFFWPLYPGDSLYHPNFDLPRRFGSRPISIGFTKLLLSELSTFSGEHIEYRPLAHPDTCLRVKEHWTLFETPPCPPQPGCYDTFVYDPAETFFTKAHICDAQLSGETYTLYNFGEVLAKTLNRLGYEPGETYWSGKLLSENVTLHPFIQIYYIGSAGSERYWLVPYSCYNYTNFNAFSREYHIDPATGILKKKFPFDVSQCSKKLSIEGIRAALSLFLPSELPDSDVGVPSVSHGYFHHCQSSLNLKSFISCSFYESSSKCDKFRPDPLEVYFKVEPKLSFLAALVDEIFHLFFTVLSPLFLYLLDTLDSILVSLVTWLLKFLKTLLNTSLAHNFLPFFALLFLTRVLFPTLPFNIYTISLGLILYLSVNNFSESILNN